METAWLYNNNSICLSPVQYLDPLLSLSRLFHYDIENGKGCPCVSLIHCVTCGKSFRFGSVCLPVSPVLESSLLPYYPANCHADKNCRLPRFSTVNRSGKDSCRLTPYFYTECCHSSAITGMLVANTLQSGSKTRWAFQQTEESCFPFELALALVTQLGLFSGRLASGRQAAFVQPGSLSLRFQLSCSVRQERCVPSHGY